MAREIDWEIRERAEELYVVDGLTFDQVAKETGVSVTQLKNWSGAEGWRDKREEYRVNKQSIRSTVTKLRKKLALDALSHSDPQKVFAFIRLEALAGRQEKKAVDAPKIDRPALFLEDMEFIASVLKESDPEGLKILAKSFDVLIEQIKAKYASET
jgi:transposase-like protein